MTISLELFRLANKLYTHCYPCYSPLYAAWKAFSDRAERALLRQIIRPRMTIVDVGANVGVYTKYLARLTGHQGQVHAFEPDPLNFARLRARVGGLGFAFLNQSAVGARSGTLSLYVSEELNVDHRTFDAGDGRARIDVPVTSLDDYFSPGQRVDFVKIDVQGFELSVLEGATRVLTDNPGIKVLMEFWPYGLMQASVSPRDVLGLLSSLGFQARRIGEVADREFDPATLDHTRIDDYCNLLVTRSSLHRT